MFARIKKSSILNIIFVCAILIGVAHISNRTFATEDENTIFIQVQEEDFKHQTIKEKEQQKQVSSIFTQNDIFESAKERIITGYFYGEHCAYQNIIERSINESERITMILHISYDRLRTSLIPQIDNWDGPISLAVVFPSKYNFNSSETKCVTNFLNVLYNNHTGVREKLSVHLLIQNQKSKTCGTIITTATNETDLENAICKDDTIYTQKELVSKMAHYAVNDARNLARNLSTTKYILIADMDHFFSKNFESKMLGLAKATLDNDPKTVLVYRIFEVANSVKKMPETKKELQALLRKNKAQEFHKFYGAHSIPKLQEWFKIPDSGSENTTIQYYRKYRSYHWEPQFVSLTDIPYHDPKFFYSLRDNTVLRWEMCRAGYKFAIINDVFMYHPGIKTRKESYAIDKVRNLVRRWSWKSLRAFNKRMDTLYPETKKECPRFNQF
uniref:Uncharacterized protein n=1 Tax=Panagrolaimus sp. PS1159 TaxID=55785 RepID=A0AC35FPY9_9BILA